MTSFAPRRNIATLAYTVLLAFLPLLGSSLTTWWALENQPLIAQFGWAEWAAFFVVAVFTMAFALTPTTFVALLSGFLLGWVSVPPLCVAYLSAAFVGHWFISRLDNGNLLAFLSRRPKVATFVKRLQSGSLGVIVLSRLSPVLPFAVMNAVFALVKIPVRPFLWGSFVGMLPRTVLSVWAGTQAQQLRVLLENPNDSLPWRIGLAALTLVSVGGLGWMLRRPRS